MSVYYDNIHHWTADEDEPEICEICGAELSAGQECDLEEHAEAAAEISWHGYEDPVYHF